MMLSWIILFLGGLCEVAFVTMMKFSNGFRNLKFSLLTFLFMAISLYSLSYALKVIPIGTGYAVWTGIGAVGSVLVGMFYFKESKSVAKLLFILMIVIGVAGLKISSY